MLKKLDLFHLITNTLLAFLIALTGAGCLCTAFSLDVTAGGILLACLFWAVATNVALQFSKGWLVLLGLLLPWGLLLRKLDVLDSLGALACQLLTFYDRAYGWGVPDFLQAVSPSPLTPALMMLCATGSMIATISLNKGKGIWAMIMAALPLIPCLVVTDTVPAAGWLFVALVLVALLLITASVRKVDGNQASRLTAMLLVPVLLSGWLLFALNPQDTYDKASDEEDFGMRVLELLDKIPLVETDEHGNIWLDVDIPMPTVIIEPSDVTMPTITIPQNVTLPNFTVGPEILELIREQVSLENAGPRVPSSSRVMTITTTFRGTLYLRERGYDLYTGSSWGRSDDVQILETSPKYLESGILASITTTRRQSIFFVPYYTYIFSEELPKGYKENPSKLLSYNFQFYPLREDWQALWRSQHATPISQITEYLQYLQLTDYARVRGQELLEQIGVSSETDVVTAANIIQNYVKNSATYNLNTPAMPEDAKDFAIWFLTESDTGYCVHFASAATVLLRAAGIPARYVEGYMAPVLSNSTRVTQQWAHAWVEYYVPDVGWVILEATPSGEDPGMPPETTLPTEPTEPTTEPTTPPETTVPPTTEPTAPPETTVPPTTEPTAPQETTVPSTTVPSTPPETTQAPTTVPGTSTSVPPTTETTQPDPVEPRPGLWAALSTLLFLLAVLCALIGQWQLRLWLKQFLRSRGNTNRQAVTLFRQCRVLARLRRQKIPAVLRDLAWKACYSQYTITPEELLEFYGYMDRSLAHLKKRPWYLRIIYRTIFAAY